MNSLLRRVAVVGLGAAMLLPAIAPASAQGILELLFGRRSVPAQMSYAIQNALPDFDGAPPQRHAEGGGTAFCVRLCDGRYFPINARGGDGKELCNSFCPAAQTKVFYGGNIEHASAGGQRYADLPNAFLYREKLSNDCTCNGKDAVGLAQVDVSKDVTLRGGDVVATNEGLVAYRGSSRGGGQNFTPVANLKSQWGAIRVQPAPVTASVAANASGEAEGLAVSQR